MLLAYEGLRKAMQVVQPQSQAQESPFRAAAAVLVVVRAVRALGQLRPQALLVGSLQVETLTTLVAAQVT